ncbi:Ltp family lipoprotein, partial [Corynebacterium heidelbergense]
GVPLSPMDFAYIMISALPSGIAPPPAFATDDPLQQFQNMGQEGKDLPNEYKEDPGAMARARMYSNVSHLSRKALTEMMTNGIGGSYPPEITRYAVDHIGADWNDNAAKSAQMLKDVGTPPEKVYDVLTSDYGGKFTPEEARFGVDHLK